MREAVRQLPTAVDSAVRKVARDTALRVKAGARQRVPVDTGITRDSIDVEPHPEEKFYRVGVFRALPHVLRRASGNRTAFLDVLPIWLEYGTKRGKKCSHTGAARPFLGPALRAEESRYISDMEAAAVNAVRRAVE
jgi:hypothetical protein